MSFLLTEQEFSEANDAVTAGTVTGPLYAFLRRLTLAVVRSGSVATVLSESGHWDHDAADNLLQDWLAERLLGGGLLQAFDSAATPRALSRYLERALRNYLIDQGRRRAAPRLLPRAHGILASSERYRCFVESSSWLDRAWGLAGWSEPSAFKGEEAELVRAAYALGDFELVRFGPGTERAEPVISNPDLERFLAGLFAELERTLTLRDVEQALRGRFAFAFDEVSLELDAVGEVAGDERPVLDQLETAETATQVMAEINERQLAILLDRAYEGLTLDELAARHNVSRSTADNELKRVGRIIERNLPPGIGEEQILDKLLELAS
ncbi:MAG: sigma factor-like helix-turn-helix DNA-binding protein [Actinomycetota bacterium]